MPVSHSVLTSALILFTFSRQDTLRKTEQNHPGSISFFEPGFYLVKLQFPIKKGMKEEIVRLSKDESPLYLPHDVYIASMIPSAASSISSLEGVVGVYHLPAGWRNDHPTPSLPLSKRYLCVHFTSPVLSCIRAFKHFTDQKNNVGRCQGVARPASVPEKSG